MGEKYLHEPKIKGVKVRTGSTGFFFIVAMG
jgi:hypothetical protein